MGTPSGEEPGFRLPVTSVLETAFNWSQVCSNCATVEISQIPKQDLFSRISLLETPIAQFLNKHITRQFHYDGLNETSLASADLRLLYCLKHNCCIFNAIQHAWH